jgi:molybdopterin-guanine dinucleotide biosynthesis protein A
MHKPLPLLTAVVLAGGLSRRLGRDKALLEFGGQTLLARTVEVLAPLCREVIVVTNSPQAHAHPAARLVGDLLTRVIAYLTSQTPGFDVVMPRHHSLLEPLHSIYSKTCLPFIEDLLRERRLRIRELLPLVRVRYVDESELTPWDPDHRSFRNINTPQDLAEARALLEGHP